MVAIVAEYTISATVSNFIIDRQVRGLSPNTIRYYRDELMLLERYLTANDITSIDDLTAHTIRAFFVELAERRSIGGVHSVYRSVKAFCNWWQAETDGAWKNPITKVDVKAAKVRSLPGVPIADIQAMINACKTDLGQRDQTMLRLLLDTGCRAFEFVSLDIGDVDLLTGAVKIQKGKGDKERTVYIGKSCRRELRRYLKSRTKLHPSSPLWLTDDGERLTKRGLMAVVERRAKGAGVDAPGLHDFRRAFALNMWRNGVDILALSRLMGHSDLATTKRYIADFDSDLREAHAKGSPVDNAGL